MGQINAFPAYAAMKGEAICFASSNKDAASGVAEIMGGKLVIGLFLPQNGVPISKRRAAPTRELNPELRGKDEMTVHQVAAMKGLASGDSVRYAIRAGVLKGIRRKVPGGDQERVFIRRTDAENWIPSPKYLRKK